MRVWAARWTIPGPPRNRARNGAVVSCRREGAGPPSRGPAGRPPWRRRAPPRGPWGRRCASPLAPDARQPEAPVGVDHPEPVGLRELRQERAPRVVGVVVDPGARVEQHVGGGEGLGGVGGEEVYVEADRHREAYAAEGHHGGAEVARGGPLLGVPGVTLAPVADALALGVEEHGAVVPPRPERAGGVLHQRREQGDAVIAGQRRALGHGGPVEGLGPGRGVALALGEQYPVRAVSGITTRSTSPRRPRRHWSRATSCVAGVPKRCGNSNAAIRNMTIDSPTTR